MLRSTGSSRGKLGCACGIRGPPRYDTGRVSSRSRRTGPRVPVLGGFLGSNNVPLPRRARACPSPCCDQPEVRGGNSDARVASEGPALRYWAGFFTIAGGRPPRYGIGRVSWQQPGPLPRRARACPSPCFGLPNDRGGQAPALRY